MKIYQIKVIDLPSHLTTDLFYGLSVTPLQNGETLLTAMIVDQAALRGLLNHLWDLNTTVVAIERIENE